MKYLTEEFYTLEILSYANSHVRKSKKAEQKDENFYRHTFEKVYAIFERFSKSCDWYHDTEEDLKKIEEYVNEPNITLEERKRRIEFKKMHEYLYDNRNKTVYPFDEALCKEQFEERNRFLASVYSQLPQEILSKIADIRVFVLGYASAEVKKLLRPYCAKLQKTVKEIKNKAYSETDEAERYLSQEFGFNEYEEFLLSGIEEKNGNIYLKGEENDCLMIKNGKILEGKDKIIFPYDGNKPNCPWSRIIYAELHRINDKFELHYLVENSDTIGKADLWNLTISGTDIIDINP